MKAVIYARYSTDLQNERSIDDQVRLCRQHAVQHGWDVVEVYADYAISGGHLRSRPNAVQLLEDARAGRFGLVLAEALDRISRDQEDTAAIYKRLTFAGVAIHTVTEGDISEMHVGLSSTMSAMFLRGLATKIRRGQEGRVLKGACPGSLGYGYQVVREYDAGGDPIRGKRRTDPDQASIVRRIFAEVAAGHSPRAIAAQLNAEGVPAPFGGIWRASTINGNRARGTGILWNQAYIGLLVYNRVTMVKDPDSGKRLSRLNPPDKWVVVPVPDWRIVSDEAWNAVQAYKASYDYLAVHRQRRPKHLLSGLVVCGVCGGSYTIKSRTQLACSRYREAGACQNNHIIRVRDLERRIFFAIKEQLLAPSTVAQAMSDYRSERRKADVDRAKQRALIEARLAEIERELTNMANAVAQAGWSDVLGDRLRQGEEDRRRLRDELAALAEPTGVVEIHPAALRHYREAVDQLELVMAEDEQAREEAMQIIRPLIRRIEVFPGDKRGATGLRLHGTLPELVGLARRKPGEAARTVMVVAEEGLEPPTRGL